MADIIFMVFFEIFTRASILSVACFHFSLLGGFVVVTDIACRHPLKVDALYQGYGNHHANLWVGMRVNTLVAQCQTITMDIGSSVTAFPYQKCYNPCNQYY